MAIEAGNEQLKRAFSNLFKSSKCNVCNQVLEGSVTYASEFYWCHNHFTCARCNVGLQDGNYVTLNNKSYCPLCFDKARPLCNKCGHRLESAQKYYLFDKTFWHDTCFAYSGCGDPLDQSNFVWDNNNNASCSNCAQKNPSTFWL